MLDRESAGKQKRRFGIWIMFALLLVAAVRLATRLYMVQEILVVLLLLAVSTVTVLGFAVAVILLQEGIRQVALWAKIGLIRHGNLSPQNHGGHR